MLIFNFGVPALNKSWDSIYLCFFALFILSSTKATSLLVIFKSRKPEQMYTFIKSNFSFKEYFKISKKPSYKCTCNDAVYTVAYNHQQRYICCQVSQRESSITFRRRIAGRVLEHSAPKGVNPLTILSRLLTLCERHVIWSFDHHNESRKRGNRRPWLLNKRQKKQESSGELRKISCFAQDNICGKRIFEVRFLRSWTWTLRRSRYKERERRGFCKNWRRMVIFDDK